LGEEVGRGGVMAEILRLYELEPARVVLRSQGVLLDVEILGRVKQVSKR